MKQILRHTLLNKLVEEKMLHSYKIHNVSEDNVVDAVSKFRNTRRIILTFPNLTKIVFDSFCSGSSEDTSIYISKE